MDKSPAITGGPSKQPANRSCYTPMARAVIIFSKARALKCETVADATCPPARASPAPLSTIFVAETGRFRAGATSCVRLSQGRTLAAQCTVIRLRRAAPPAHNPREPVRQVLIALVRAQGVDAAEAALTRRRLQRRLVG